MLHDDHHAYPREKHHDKFHPSLEIVVNQDVITLKGTGVDVEPAVLSGNVILHLGEPTSIREISLQFRGKARLPASAAEP
jgi:arrestin-related trafficking adapter 4/5/7